MAFQTCPTDLVEASAETVWVLLTTPRLYEEWVDARLREGPERPIAVGDRLLLGAGPGHRMKVVFDVVGLTPMREVVLDVRLPFGLGNHEVLRITPLGSRRCRVTYD